MKDLVSNRKARHDYEILETFEAGIALQGTEIKSLRAGGGSLQEAYVRVIQNELFLIGAFIPVYSHGNIHNHKERRDRKLLMHRREITRLKAAVQEKGRTLVPLAIYLKKGRAKLSVGLAVGKKSQDKRQVIREREEKRRIEKIIKQHRG